MRLECSNQEFNYFKALRFKTKITSPSLSFHGPGTPCFVVSFNKFIVTWINSSKLKDPVQYPCKFLNHWKLMSRKKFKLIPSIQFFTNVTKKKIWELHRSRQLSPNPSKSHLLQSPKIPREHFYSNACTTKNPRYAPGTKGSADW